MDGELVSLGFIFVRLGDAFVFNVSDVTIFVGFVSDDLSAAIGKEDAVRSDDVTLVISAFLVSVIVVGRIILDGPGEAVRHRGLYCTTIS